MRKTKEEADITRQRLLQAALVVFSRQGYSDTRLEDIAAEAGVTRGAIYHHFGGKAELYSVLVAEASARIQPIIADAIAGAVSTLDVLRRMFVTTLLYAATDAEFRAVNELVAFKTAIIPELAEGVQMKIAGWHALLDITAQHIQNGIDSGEIRGDVNPKDAAFALMALQNGALTLWLLDESLFPLGKRAEALAELYIRGIAAD